MLIHSLSDTDGSQCRLVFEEHNYWLRATWSGYVDYLEAMRGAESYLARVAPLHCPCLLNDNLALEGPWFDSLDWLEHAWLPHAQRLGLRYVAHVVQADTRTDIISRSCPRPLPNGLDLQIFHRLAEAEEWLRHCQCQSPPRPQLQPVLWRQA